jgi:hypothetical protein
MESLFDKLRTKIPKYNEVYKSTLFEALSNLGGGTEKARYNLGKHFSNNYEFYLYAFFLGLYSKQFKPIESTVKKTDFNHAIEFWGSKGNRPGRHDFKILQEYLFAAAIAKADIDLLEIDKGSITEDEVVKILVETIEAYTNGGLMLISEKLDESPNYFLQAPSFLNLILEADKG